MNNIRSGKWIGVDNAGDFKWTGFMAEWPLFRRTRNSIWWVVYPVWRHWTQYLFRLITNASSYLLIVLWWQIDWFKVGLQQGDPGGMGFRITIHTIVEKLKSELHIWYLDDGTMGVILKWFCKIWHQLGIENCKGMGLKINPSKCELYFCSQEDSKVTAQF